MGTLSTNEAFRVQKQLLNGVSRTFALTIPVLPAELSVVVSNAYLLCRVVDTIEDDPALSLDEKKYFAERFLDVVLNHAPAALLSEELGPRLSEQTLKAEHELIANLHSVIAMTHMQRPVQQQAIGKCLTTMTEGMLFYQAQETRDGLPNLEAMNRYCYYVAGVVGEMLTELFAIHCPSLREHKEAMKRLAISFGQGLQMTNILKDIWDDRQREACWLPANFFELGAQTLSDIQPGEGGPSFSMGLGKLIAIAHGHLQNALTYTVFIPKHERGIRIFCLSTIALAVLTLRKMNSKRHFKNSEQIKISRRSVKASFLSTRLFLPSNRAINLLFHSASMGIPKTHIPPESLQSFASIPNACN